MVISAGAAEDNAQALGVRLRRRRLAFPGGELGEVAGMYRLRMPVRQ